MNVQEFIEKHMEGSEVFTDVNCQEVHCGDDKVEHKMVYQTSVYQVTYDGVEQYFEVTNTRDNTGYWSDGERYDPQVHEVKPVKKVVEIIEWEAV